MDPDASPIRKRPSFSWLVSEDIELLEAEGATSRGISIIDELNAVYARTGAVQPIRSKVVAAVRELLNSGQREVRIIEIGTRDGTLLRQIGADLVDGGLQAELHGVEFRENLVELARLRASKAKGNMNFHFVERKNLDSLRLGSFDIVFSAFTLHHQSRTEIADLLAQCQRMSRAFVFHLDLDRSLLGAICIWLVYTVLDLSLIHI